MSDYSQTLVFTLENRVDIATIKRLEPELRELSETQSPDLIIDMTQVNFIDSSGIGAIVFLYKRLKSRGHHLRLLNVSGQPFALLQQLRINKVIHFITHTDVPYDTTHEFDHGDLRYRMRSLG